MISLHDQQCIIEEHDDGDQFTGAHFLEDMILMGVHWSVAHPLSMRHVEERMEERGVYVDHSTMNRWVIT